ncbi:MULTISPECIES: hypothetical protein [unclassified Tolypothrix]|uniref:hypothetical protein n=1 Tax=unclassified Tolypothrix TaxID=2649714 RepID=UPI0005EAA9D0|nr:MULTISPECIES: hypothetical protein [unclassified Tolypothrix]BAY90381.1 hypothetical protein NIES3275_23970 [Microchaete diplosiphon NIES-3275]EKE98715.1 hypothetical protein FDUTEX481_03630 [Tolypothrix sp. PCC 7601]MBE9084264.1 hypothetical protein [Tolypothrix sp. LEGE 11397]UYD24559.1 hypothetical protein HGR01_24395 [Tolypothrix sp. PCC 7712]UYD33212.1 hypothetical protein HG267_30275 [Tolypothrix sp. PCC 7601]
MAQKRRNSIALTKAERRIEGMQMINSDLDFGNGLSIASYQNKILEIRDKLTAYNQAKTMVETTHSALVAAESELNMISEQMLLSVASRYGKTSDEYGMAGGTRRIYRKKARPAVPTTLTTDK